MITLRDVVLAIAASTMMVAGFAGWFESRKAHSLPIISLNIPIDLPGPLFFPIIRPSQRCNFQYPYGYAPHRVRYNWNEGDTI